VAVVKKVPRGNSVRTECVGEEAERTEMNPEKFCLSWNDFEKNIGSAFRELRESKVRSWQAFLSAILISKDADP